MNRIFYIKEVPLNGLTAILLFAVGLDNFARQFENELHVAVILLESISRNLAGLCFISYGSNFPVKCVGFGILIVCEGEILKAACSCQFILKIFKSDIRKSSSKAFEVAILIIFEIPVTVAVFKCLCSIFCTGTGILTGQTCIDSICEAEIACSIFLYRSLCFITKTSGKAEDDSENQHHCR